MKHFHFWLSRKKWVLKSEEKKRIMTTKSADILAEKWRRHTNNQPLCKSQQSSPAKNCQKLLAFARICSPEIASRVPGSDRVVLPGSYAMSQPEFNLLMVGCVQQGTMVRTSYCGFTLQSKLSFLYAKKTTIIDLAISYTEKSWTGTGTNPHLTARAFRTTKDSLSFLELSSSRNRIQRHVHFYLISYHPWLIPELGEFHLERTSCGVSWIQPWVLALQVLQVTCFQLQTFTPWNNYNAICDVATPWKGTGLELLHCTETLKVRSIAFFQRHFFLLESHICTKGKSSIQGMEFFRRESHDM